MNTEVRKDCPMRHKNGNCMPAGGFCTAVNDPICEALHNAYDTGRRAADVVEVVRCKDCKHSRNMPLGLCYLHTEPSTNATGYKGEAVCVNPDDFCSYGARRTE